MGKGSGGGRPCKPLSLLKLQGTYTRSRHANRIDDELFTGEPDAAEWLEMEAQLFWDREITKLVKAGVATEADSTLLQAMAQLWARYRHADAKSNAYLDNVVVYARWQRLALGALKQFEQLAGRFGMTPADRAKLRVQPAKDETDETEERFFA